MKRVLEQDIVVSWEAALNPDMMQVIRTRYMDPLCRLALGLTAKDNHLTYQKEEKAAPTRRPGNRKVLTTVDKFMAFGSVAFCERMGVFEKPIAEVNLLVAAEFGNLDVWKEAYMYQSMYGRRYHQYHETINVSNIFPWLYEKDWGAKDVPLTLLRIHVNICHRSMEQAMVGGHFDVAERICRYGNGMWPRPLPEILHALSAGNHVDSFMALYQTLTTDELRDNYDNMRLLANFACHGNIRTMEWIMARNNLTNASYFGDVAERAVEAGQVAILQWFHDKGFLFHRHLNALLLCYYNAAIRGQSLASLQWLHGHGYCSPLANWHEATPEIFAWAWKNGLVKGNNSSEVCSPSAMYKLFEQALPLIKHE
jgi:hypothetical protein